MIHRLVSAGARAIFVALLIITPALLLPGGAGDVIHMIALLALAAAVLTFVEYMATYPSLIEFRDAKPLNRLRFTALFVTVLMLSLISRGQVYPTELSRALTGLGGAVGAALDFTFSPVRLMVLLLPESADIADQWLMRILAGLAYVISLTTLAGFVVLVRVFNWPISHGAFNFWVNLPLFDPTAGADILRRLKRDSHINVALGFLLPFLVPAVLKIAATLGSGIDLADPQTMIWVVSAWALLPASLIMRGIALMRIAELIEEKRRRAYAQADLQVHAL